MKIGPDYNMAYVNIFGVHTNLNKNSAPVLRCQITVN